eukprot:scaffold20288_cov193-Skeletonema_dohrnii-CCMP3373.AAC.4
MKLEIQSLNLYERQGQREENHDNTTNFSDFCPLVSCHQKEKRDGRRGENATNSTVRAQPPNNRKQAAHVKKCQNRGRREEAHRDPCHAIRP